MNAKTPFWALSASFLLMVAAGCSSGQPVLATYGPIDASLVHPPGTGGGGGSTIPGEGGDGLTDADIPPGAGVGQPCSTPTDCRVGLVCTANKCAPGHTLPQGSLCVTSAECQSGLYCSVTRTCSPAGTGTAGTSCRSDADCTSDLKCGIVGMYPVCTTPGQGDLYAVCTTGLDCLGNLTCISGACSFMPPGWPLSLATWAGETCETESGSPITWFTVPRASGNKDFYRLPFPNDIRTKDEVIDGGLVIKHPDLTGHPVPGPGLLGFDIVDRTLRAIETDNDGWSAYPTVYFRFNAWPKFDSLTILDSDGGVIGYRLNWIDITADIPNRGRSWSANSERGKYMCGNWLVVRPSQGDPLTPGHTYAVTMESGVTIEDGTPVAATADFDAMMATTAPADAALTAAWNAYKPLRDYAGPKGLPKLINAAVFTVGKVRDRASNVGKAATGGPVAVTWASCASGADAGGDAGTACACGAADPAFDEYHAVIPMPIYQTGTAPYLDTGGTIAAFGKIPAEERKENVCAALTVPKGKTMPAAGWPLVVYAHGTGGDFRSHIREGVAAMLAGAKDGATDAPMAVLGIDQVQNGARRGGSSESPNTLFYNYRNPRAARDNVLQGVADQIFLGRVAVGTSSPKIDGAKVLFWGHSQGATQGSIAGPLTDAFGAVVLSGQGASLMDSLVSKTKPQNIAGALPIALLDPDPNNPTTLWGGGVNPVLALMQTLGDPADPLNFASGMAISPLVGGVTQHHVFQVYGQNDSYSPDGTEATYAIAAGLSVAAHDSSVTKPDPIGGSVEKPTPVSGNVATNITGAVREYAPAAGKDGHFVAFDNATAKEDITRFLAQAARGKVPEVGKVLIVNAGGD